MNVETPDMDSRAAERFVERYGQAWDRWDIEGFIDLFAENVVYAAHPQEIVVGRESLRTYPRKEEAEQGLVRVRMGRPVIGQQAAMAEFWVNAHDGSMSIAGCLIFKLAESDGRCAHFREYWFDLEGTVEPFVTRRRPRRILVVLVGVLTATVAITAVLGTTTAATTPTRPAGVTKGVVSTGNVGTVRSCARDDLTVEIDIRRPSSVLQGPDSGVFAPKGRGPVATMVVRNPGTQRCYLSSGEFDLTIRDRTGKTVMGRWDRLWFGGSYPPGFGKPFSLPNVYTCDRQGPFIAEATVNHLTARRDNLSRSEITC